MDADIAMAAPVVVKIGDEKRELRLLTVAQLHELKLSIIELPVVDRLKLKWTELDAMVAFNVPFAIRVLVMSSGQEAKDIEKWDKPLNLCKHAQIVYEASIYNGEEEVGLDDVPEKKTDKSDTETG